MIIGLHDVPVGDADDRRKGRDVAYRRLAELAALVVVASSAEAGRLRALAPGARGRGGAVAGTGHGSPASRGW